MNAPEHLCLRLKPSDHRLAGVIERFNRGKRQFDELNEEMDTFFNGDPKPHFSSGGFDSEAWEWVVRFQIREETPVVFGVILGDVLHNLRSALDNLMWQITLLDGGTPNRKTQFPIVIEGKKQFDRRAKRCIRGLTAQHRALVDEAQPYHAADNARLHPLAVLNELANTDKHRLVLPIYSFMANDMADEVDRLVQQMEKNRESGARGVFIAKQGQRLEHGTPWLRIPWDRDAEPPRNVTVGANIRLGILFGDIGLDAKEMPRIAEGVLHIIQRFQAEFPETEFLDEVGEDSENWPSQEPAEPNY